MSLQVPVNDRFVKVSPSTGTAVIDTDYPVIAAADVEVWRQRGDIVSKLTLSTDYTVSLLGNQLGARVTLSPASLAGDVYVVAGARSSERMTSFIEGQFRSDDINDELTSVLILLQELRSLALRAVRFPPMSGDLSSEIPAGSVAGLLGLSSTGALELRSSTGSTFHVTTTTPGAGLGVDNDLCLVVNAADAAHGKVFTKASGAWTDKGSIRGPAGTGDVSGPVSSTDNALARYDLGTGKVLQNSVVTADDVGNLSNVKYIELDEIAMPGAPASGKRRLYTHDEKLWTLGSTGGEVAAEGGAGAIGINLLINGDFQINQRAFAGGSLAAGSYGFDRWKAGASACNISVSGYVVTLASGPLVQVIEPALWGYTSFASTAITISLDTPSADIAVTFGTASGTITAGSGRRSVTLNTGAPDTGNLTLSLSAAVSVTFGRLKLEVGTLATAWQARPSSQERALCMRYWYTTTKTTAIVFYGYNTGGSTPQGTFTHPVEMRVAPTATKFGTWSVSNAVQPIISVADVLYWRVYTTVTTTGGFIFNTTSSSGAYFDAEI